MRFISYSATNDNQRFGVLDEAGDGVIDLTDRMTGVSDFSDVLAAERLDEAASLAAGASADVALADITYERTIPRPGRIFCIGVNYGGRAAEYDDTTDKSYPSVFVRFPSSFTGHEQALVRPPESKQLDYEGEIVIVVGKGGRRIAEADARSHIAGACMGNEGTIRDWVRHAKFNVTQGKNWDTTGAIGPWMRTIDEIPDFESLRITTTVNSELRQDDSPATMKYPIEYQIAYLSTFCTLDPGDIIFTGTPTGAGARFDPPIWLVPGDVVEINVDEIGTLRNTVRDE